MRLAWIPLVVGLLAGCMQPCEPELWMSWEDAAWYNATMDHPQATLDPVATFDLGIQDPALAAYEPFVTRSLQGPGIGLYHDETGFYVHTDVPANETLASRRDDIAPALEALGLDVDATLEQMAKDRTEAAAVQTSDGFDVLSWRHTARVEPDVQGWWDHIGGLHTANVTATRDGAYLTWEGWAVEVQRLGHSITMEGVRYDVDPDGGVTARADAGMGRSDYLAAVDRFATAHGVSVPDITPHVTDCVVRE